MKIEEIKPGMIVFYRFASHEHYTAGQVEAVDVISHLVRVYFTNAGSMLLHLSWLKCKDPAEEPKRDVIHSELAGAFVKHIPASEYNAAVDRGMAFLRRTLRSFPWNKTLAHEARMTGTEGYVDFFYKDS